jgi:hypothetical protein
MLTDSTCGTLDGKAKVYVRNGPVGVIGKTGELTSWMNVYRTKTGFVHATPGESGLIDVAPVLRSFAAKISTWDESQSLDVANTMSANVAGRVSWDGDAGEEWASVIAPERAVAYVSMIGPLVFVVRDTADVGLLNTTSSLEVVRVPELDTPALRCEPDVLIAALGPRAVSSAAMNPECFAAQDLWFATI